MAKYSWRRFLKQWSEVILSTDLRQVFPPEVSEAGWIGDVGAREAEITRVEARLRCKLPPSYRQFLKITNGWPMLIPFLGKLLPVQQVERLSAHHAGLIEDWRLGEGFLGYTDQVLDEAYFVYGESQDPSSMSSQYLPDTLAISDLNKQDNSIYLLNPEVVTPEGEWEAWFLAAWLPGAMRYRSFWDLMQAEYLRCGEVLETERDWTSEFLQVASQRLQPRQPRL